MILINANADLISVSDFQFLYTNYVKTQAFTICTPTAPSKANGKVVGGSCALALHEKKKRLFLSTVILLLIARSVKLNCMKNGN